MAEKLIRASQVDLSGIEDSLELLQNQVESEQEALTQEILERKNADDEIKVDISDLEQGLSDLEENKQNKLIAGPNIFINPETNVISASGGLSEVAWGNIKGTLSNQTDLQKELDDINDKIEEIELFKFPNAIIIGEPTIQNGQVSDFSTVSYLQFPFILDLHEKAFQIDMCFTTATNVQTQQNILDSKFGLALAIQNGKGVMAISSNGTNWDIGSVVGTQTLQSNTTYYARLIWNRLQYKTQLSTDGVNYVDDMVIVDTRRPFPTTIFIGGCDMVETGHTGHPFLGSINLNKCSLSVMGSVIWQGMDDAGLATRADVSLDNLDAAGQAKFDAKQDTLVSGTNIKTINNESILGEGNIEIKGGADNAYTRDNLVAGKGISFEEKPAESGGIDEYTIGCWHFNDNLQNEVVGSDIQITSDNVIYSDGKFGKCADGGRDITLPNFGSHSEYTIDFWLNPKTTWQYFVQFYGCVNIRKSDVVVFEDSYGSVYWEGQIDGWTHIAITFSNNNMKIYVGGELKATIGGNFSNVWGGYIYQSKASMDELRFSNIVRWNSNFVPPNTPYSTEEGDAKKTIINSTATGFDFEGTLAEYEQAQPTLADDAKCLITDDVGSIPTEITQEQLNDKADRDLGNVLANIDYVVESKIPTSDDPTWYRVYKSGWLEQGGIAKATSDSAYVVTLPKTMINSLYTVMITRDTGTSEYGIGTINARWQIVYNKNITSFTTWGIYGGKDTFMWEAKGQGDN